MRKLLIAGNTLMPRCIGIFNLPPLKTCTPSEWCREHCYALYGRHCWSTVKESQKWRYKQSLKNDFVNKMIQEIRNRKSLKFIRIHLAGDFYSKEYIDKWAQIAEALPEYTFRVNTKRVDFMKYIKQRFPKNIIVRESTDPSRKSHGLFPQAAVEGTPGSKRFFWCIDNCNRCKYYCFLHPKRNIVFKQIR
jgi:hypothetical protein